MGQSDVAALEIVLLLAKLTTHEVTTDEWREAIARVQALVDKGKDSIR